jgi:hypothetical protein
VNVPERKHELERERKLRQARTPSRTPEPVHRRYVSCDPIRWQNH